MYAPGCDVRGVPAALPTDVDLAKLTANGIVRDDWEIAFYSARVLGRSDYIMDDGRPHVVIETVADVRGQLPVWMSSQTGR